MIGYKKIVAYKGYIAHMAIATLLIPDDAKKCNPKGSSKWRCDKAKVLNIETPDGSMKFTQGRSFFAPHNRGIYGVMYYVNQYVYPLNGFDDDETKECSRGIHFFLTKKEAIVY